MKIQILEAIFKLNNKQARRVLRGGGWNVSGMIANSAQRNHYAPDYRNDFIGFCLVQEV